MKLLAFLPLLYAVGIHAASSERLAEFRPVGDLGMALEDEFYVKLAPGHSLNAHFEAIGINLTQIAESFREISLLDAYLVKLSASIVHDHVRCDPGVEYVQENYAALASPIKTARSEPRNVTESEEARDLQKRAIRREGSMDIMDMRGASKAMQMHTAGGKIAGGPRTGGMGKFDYDGGTGVRVYVLDSGIRTTHQAFHGRVERFHRPSYVPGGDGTDTDGHGTMVASALLMSVNSITPFVRVVSVQVAQITNGVTYVFSLPQAITDIVTEHVRFRDNPSQRPRNWAGSVINLSLWTARNPQIEAALRLAVNNGIPVIIAAGNEGTSRFGDKIASLPYVLTVGAVDENYRIWRDSNYGQYINILAFGVEVLVAKSTADNTGEWVEGTSIAAPFVASVAALVVSQERLYRNVNDVNTVYARILSNSITGAISGLRSSDPTRKTVNRLLNNGINDPRRSYGIPYYIPSSGPAGSGSSGSSSSGSGSSGSTQNNVVYNKLADDVKNVKNATASSTGPTFTVPGIISNSATFDSYTSVHTVYTSVNDTWLVVSSGLVTDSLPNATLISANSVSSCTGKDCPTNVASAIPTNWADVNPPDTTLVMVTEAAGQRNTTTAKQTTAKPTKAKPTTNSAEKTPTSTTPTSSPSESCHTWYVGYYDSFRIYGRDWNLGELDGNGGEYLHGDGLKNNLGGCSALTDWKFENLTITQSQPFQWHASGRLTIWQKTCIEHAIKSSGAPDESCIGSS